MRIPKTVLLSLLLLLCTFALADKPEPAAIPGRYALVVGPFANVLFPDLPAGTVIPDPPPNAKPTTTYPLLYRIDTQTGRTWFYDAAAKPPVWQEIAESEKTSAKKTP